MDLRNIDMVSFALRWSLQMPRTDPHPIVSVMIMGNDHGNVAP
jgi:hypothetical protein